MDEAVIRDILKGVKAIFTYINTWQSIKIVGRTDIPVCSQLSEKCTGGTGIPTCHLEPHRSTLH
jgi:hypothetical protein